MITLIAAAAVAAAQPAPTTGQQPAQHEHMQMGQNGEQHKGMDCCKDCCKDMAKDHEGHAEHKGHSAR